MQLRLSLLSSTTTTDDIARHFGDYRIGAFSKVVTIADVSREHMASYCFIRLADESSNAAAVKSMNGTMLLGNRITVEESK